MSRLKKELRDKSDKAFDKASKTYDYDFSQTAIGRSFRARVQKRLDVLFKPGMLVLDIGCGTGDDAIHLAKQGISVVACDFSSGMLTEAQKKIKREGLTSDVILRHLRAESLMSLIEELPMGFDGVYSNFGPLNMLDDLDAFARMNARLLNPGGKTLHVVMNRKPFFETVYFLLHRRFNRAFSRWHGSANVPLAGKRVPCRFYQPAEFADFFNLYFSIDRVEALGLLIPPPYLAGHFRHRRKFYRKFRWLDKALSKAPLFNTMGDHFIIEMTRERDLVSEVL